MKGRRIDIKRVNYIKYNDDTCNCYVMCGWAHLEKGLGAIFTKGD
jgi:hypothetical protein